MSLPININDLIDGRVVESARIEYTDKSNKFSRTQKLHLINSEL